MIPGALLIVIAVCAVLGGILALGIWVGRGLAEDRALQAANDAMWERVRARQARQARPTPLLDDPPTVTLPAAFYPADGWRVAGFADPFPRPGRMTVDPPPPMLALQTAPHVGTPRPLTSPMDLDADVRRMCDETELYVAALIARARHAERNYTW